MVLLWWRRWRRKARKASQESERKRDDAAQKLADVERDAHEAQELARRMREHARINNFAAMVEEAFRVRPRKRGGQQ